jgi:hypothetical protein
MRGVENTHCPDSVVVVEDAARFDLQLHETDAPHLVQLLPRRVLRAGFFRYARPLPEQRSY